MGGNGNEKGIVNPVTGIAISIIAGDAAPGGRGSPAALHVDGDAIELTDGTLLWPVYRDPVILPN